MNQVDKMGGVFLSTALDIFILNLIIFGLILMALGLTLIILLVCFYAGYLNGWIDRENKRFDNLEEEK